MEKNSPQHKHLMPSTLATDLITKFLARTLDTIWAALVLLMLRDRKLSCNYLQALSNKYSWTNKCGHNYILTKTEKDGMEVLCLTCEKQKKDIYKRLWLCIANLKRHPIVGCVFSAMSWIPLKALNMLPFTWTGTVWNFASIPAGPWQSHSGQIELKAPWVLWLWRSKPTQNGIMVLVFAVGQKGQETLLLTT